MVRKPLLKNDNRTKLFFYDYIIPNAKREGANYFISFLTDELVFRDVSFLG